MFFSTISLKLKHWVCVYIGKWCNIYASRQVSRFINFQKSLIYVLVEQQTTKWSYGPQNWRLNSMCQNTALRKRTKQIIILYNCSTSTQKQYAVYIRIVDEIRQMPYFHVFPINEVWKRLSGGYGHCNDWAAMRDGLTGSVCEWLHIPVANGWCNFTYT